MQGTGLPVIRDMAVCHLCASMNDGALVSLTKELIRFKSEATPGEDSRMTLDNVKNGRHFECTIGMIFHA
jgi:hypothetical protein